MRDNVRQQQPNRLVHCRILQVPGCTSAKTVLTALRKLPTSTSQDQDCLVPLVAEVVMDGEHHSMFFVIATAL